MSITAVDSPNLKLGLYLCWLGAAIFVAVMTGILRPRRVPAQTNIPDAPSDLHRAEWAHNLLLVVGAIGIFSTWVLAQFLFFTVRHPATDNSGALRWTPTDLLLLQLIAPSIAWGVGYSLLRRPQLKLIAYSRRRFIPGIFAGVLGILIAFPMVKFALDATEAYWVHLQYNHESKHQVLTAIDQSGGIVRVGLMVAAIVVAPMFEEMLFRGFIQTAARRLTRSPWVAVGVSSVLFAVIHPPWTIPPIFILAVLLGLLYERTHNLWATTIMHALFNAIAIFTNSMGG